MDGDSVSCCFVWHVVNPFLPVETKETTFCFASPVVTLWKATLQRGQGRREVNYWPISFSLQYLPPDEMGYQAPFAVKVSVSFVEVGYNLPEIVPVVFDRDNNYTYTYHSSIRPEHGRLEIEVDIIIPDKYKKNKERFIEPGRLENISKDLRRLLSHPLYFDMRLQSSDPGTSFPVHSYILNTRWFHFYRGLTVRTNRDHPPTVDTDIPPDVLKDILTYLYTGSIDEFHLQDPNFEEYHTELFQTMNRYPLDHLHLVIEPESNCLFRETKTDISSSAMTFRLEKGGQLGCYAWTHSPLPDVSVETLLRFDLNKNKVPSVSYSLKITNAIKLAARVNVEYRRRIIGWNSEIRRVLYDCYHEIPCDGTEVFVSNSPLEGNLSYLNAFIACLRRREGSFEIEHSLRFVLYLSTGKQLIRIPFLNESTPKELSFNILSKHMSIVRRRGSSRNLCVVTWGENSKSFLHKEIFAVRIPKWRNVIEEVPDDDNIPDIVACAVSSNAFEFVSEYLYKGTCSRIPSNFRNEIRDFARRCGFSSLERDIGL